MHNLTSIENREGLKIATQTNGLEYRASFAGTWSSLEEWKFASENNCDSSEPITFPHYNLLNTTVKGDVIEVPESKDYILIPPLRILSPGSPGLWWLKITNPSTRRLDPRFFGQIQLCSQFLHTETEDNKEKTA